MRVHELKSWPQFFEAILSGDKTFELRRDDRGGFQVDDILRLREYDPLKGYTGRMACVRVTYILDENHNCQASGRALSLGYAILGISSYWKNKTPITAEEGKWSYDR